MFDELLKDAEAGKTRAREKLIDHVIRTCPARMPEVAKFADSAEAIATALTAVKARMKDTVAGVGTRGLDAAFVEIEETLVGLWALYSRGGLPVEESVGILLPFLKKIAPPPIKKRKHTDPPVKHPPLAETSVQRGLDILLLFHGLYQVGDFTQQPDKARAAHELFLDDWRRRIFDSSRVTWERFRALAGTAERVVGRKFGRAAALDLLAAIDRHRYDNLTPVPDVSMIACDRCGGFQRKERVRCSVCAGLFCTRCLAREGGLCLSDYAARYASVLPDVRAEIIAAAKAVCAKFRLSEHVRNAAFVRALDELGVDVVFVESAPEGGVEADAAQGRRKLQMRDRESAGAKSILFAAMARAWARELGRELAPGHETLFVDACLAVPIEEALKARPGVV